MAAWQEAVTVQPIGSASKLWPCREAARGEHAPTSLPSIRSSLVPSLQPPAEYPPSCSPQPNESEARERGSLLVESMQTSSRHRAGWRVCEDRQTEDLWHKQGVREAQGKAHCQGQPHWGKWQVAIFKRIHIIRVNLFQFCQPFLFSFFELAAISRSESLSILVNSLT